MAQNYIQDGTRITAAATAARSSGDGQLIGSNILGVASNDLANTEVGPWAIEGVFEMPKLTANVMAVGDLVNWNNTNGEFQNASSDLDNCGLVMEASDGSTSTVRVKLINPP